ncbi:hypothetical protein KIN20_013869 [Parelaphostrongylus tenuis]|uniref:Uncharacterized protein n=1 Tax=Parelaphostrongylus tenuis TaxID=148309 RepID=A0AAD5QP14_PARTN|nr:hypothetical protein KIN20_013869 [Parelaphostrongylus tenuis]
MDRKNQRVAMVELHKTGKKTADNVEIDKSASICRDVKRFGEAGKIENHPRKVVQPLCLLRKTLKRARAKFNEIRSSRCAKCLGELGISEEGVHNTVKNLACSLSGQKDETKTALKSSPDESFYRWFSLVESAFRCYEDMHGRTLYDRQI